MRLAMMAALTICQSSPRHRCGEPERMFCIGEQPANGVVMGVGSWASGVRGIGIGIKADRVISELDAVTEVAGLGEPPPTLAAQVNAVQHRVLNALHGSACGSHIGHEVVGVAVAIAVAAPVAAAVVVVVVAAVVAAVAVVPCSR